MARAIVLACLPWAAMLAGSVLAAWWLVRVNRAKLRLANLRCLHGDEMGGVQSLSFVLTLPFFILIILFIVQVSQLMIGTIAVHYAAFAAARSAVVWIPADLGTMESANCISMYYPDNDPNLEQTPPVLDPDSPDFGPSSGGMTFVVDPASPKYEKIASAAVMACMAISPSTDQGLPVPGSAGSTQLLRAYTALDPNTSWNLRIPKRLENKLAWSLAHTKCEVRFFHRNNEPPLTTWFLPDDLMEFRFNELGWQDQITVTVKHDFALLPGPGRFLAQRTRTSDGSGSGPGSQITQKEGVYTYPLEASATMNVEGEKAVVPYVYHSL